ncbi:glycosyltransferase [Archangium gephyra]
MPYCPCMARIAFLPLAESGHINATFKLARQLRAHGHEVRYLALPDVESHIRSQGWDFIPLFEHLFPKGFVDGVQTLLVSDAPRREKRAAALELRRRMAAQGSEVLFNADFEARLRENELLLVDSTYTQPALTARRVGIPTAILSTTLPLRQDLAIPAMFFRSIPTGSWWSRFKIRAFWNFFNGGIALFGGSPVQKQLREFSRQYPELDGLYDFRTHLQFGPSVKLPTLIACCAELDFPRTSTEDLHYIGPCVDLERQEPPLPPEVEQDGRPLLYCSLGSHGTRAVVHRAFFQALLDVMARKPEWRLLLAVGRNVDIASLRVPPNATVVASAPQLAALRRASVMITHGGLNSVKECLCFGVPMIVFPTGLDQPGNGARIVHHGLGLMGDLREATPETIASMIDQVSKEPGYRSRARAMRDVFLAANESDRAVLELERLLGTARP